MFAALTGPGESGASAPRREAGASRRPSASWPNGPNRTAGRSPAKRSHAKSPSKKKARRPASSDESRWRTPQGIPLQHAPLLSLGATADTPSLQPTERDDLNDLDGGYTDDGSEPPADYVATFLQRTQQWS